MSLSPELELRIQHCESETQDDSAREGRRNAGGTSMCRCVRCVRYPCTRIGHECWLAIGPGMNMEKPTVCVPSVCLYFAC